MIVHWCLQDSEGVLWTSTNKAVLEQIVGPTPYKMFRSDEPYGEPLPDEPKAAGHEAVIGGPPAADEARGQNQEDGR